MRVRAALAPLVRASTYRRGVYLLLGAVVLLPYLLLGVWMAQMWQQDRVSRPLTVLAIAAATLVAAVPPFLRGTRALETAAARFLLGVDLPEPPEGAERMPAETRLRAAMWFVLHLATGAAMGVLLLVAVPMAMAFATRDAVPGDFGLSASGFSGAPWVWSLLGVVLLVATVYATAGLGRLAAVMAPVLLGPSQVERLAALEEEARRAAERNRLARELHDSVGHALTAMVLQAGAAQAVFDTDPGFARRALGTVEEVGRGAMEELDAVLGLLRDDEPHRAAAVPTLRDLDRLCRDAGPVVDSTVGGTLEVVPDRVSREGYRIVQEALTNAARHAAGTPVTLNVQVADGDLRITVTNPLPPVPLAAAGGGRGLLGMRERVRLLGGDLSAGPDGDRWRVAAHLPLTPGESA